MGPKTQDLGDTIRGIEFGDRILGMEFKGDRILGMEFKGDRILGMRFKGWNSELGERIWGTEFGGWNSEDEIRGTEFRALHVIKILL